MSSKLLTLCFSFITSASGLAQTEFKMTANDGTKRQFIWDFGFCQR